MFKTARTILIAACAILALAGCELPDEEGTAADRADTSGSANNKTEKKANGKAGNGKAAKKEAAAPKETPAEANARESAAQYLDGTAFSRKGLIDQLKYEGFSQADAEYGVDAQKANYKKQAALSAQQYLDGSSFSRQGLIDQLKYEGYTPEQAEAGVNEVGL